MDIRANRILLLLLVLCAVILLTGCRTRTTGTMQGEAVSAAVSGSADDTQTGENASDTSQNAAVPVTAEGAEFEDAEPGSQTKQNPDSPRKEYDENAPAKIVAGTDRLLHTEGEGTGTSVLNEESDRHAARLNDLAEETATQTVVAVKADQMGVSEDADAAESAMTYYTVLLQDRTDSLFECQRANVYWETEQDHVTIHKSSPEHALILESGAYDVSARLLPENLHVDDGWVVRKNPQAIVKVVDSSVLGGSIGSPAAAEAVFQALLKREGWAGIDAVRNRQVVLISRELLEAPHLRTAAMLIVAKTCAPSLFEDVDPDRALQMLMEEVAGTLPTGVYYCAAPM